MILDHFAGPGGNAVPPLLAVHICAALGLGELGQQAAA